MTNPIAIRATGHRWVAFCRCGCKGRCGATTHAELHQRITAMTHTPAHLRRRTTAGHGGNIIQLREAS